MSIGLIKLLSLMGDTIKAQEDGVVRRKWSRGYFARNCTGFRETFSTLKFIHYLRGVSQK